MRSLRRRMLGRNPLGRDINTIASAMAHMPVAGGAADHGSLSGLSDDDHTQYFNLSQNEVITGQPTFQPASPQSPFLLSANAQGQLVTGLNADQLDNLHASTAPGASAAVVATNASGYAQIRRVGIGISPSYPLHVVSTTQPQFRLAYTAGSYYASFTVDSNGHLTIAPSGDLLLAPAGNDTYVSSGQFGVGGVPSHPLHVIAASANQVEIAWDGSNYANINVTSAGTLEFIPSGGAIVFDATLGIGSMSTSAYPLWVRDTTPPQFRLGYDNTYYADFSVDGSGDLTVYPFGGDIRSQGNLLPQATDTFDLGSNTLLWRKGWLSELDTILFVTNAVRIEGGWLIIGKDAGTIPAEISNTATQADFGKSMTVGDFVLFRTSLQVEYMQVGQLVSGTTYWIDGGTPTGYRDLDGSGKNTWPAGSVFLVLGNTGDGRIELIANGSDVPRMSIYEQGSSYNTFSEYVRIGNMNNAFGVSSNYWGLGVGDYSGGNYMKYDDTGGFLLKAGGGAVSIDDDGINIAANTSYGLPYSLSWMSGGNEVAGMYGLDLGGAGFIELHGGVNAPSGQPASVTFRANTAGNLSSWLKLTAQKSGGSTYFTLHADPTDGYYATLFVSQGFSVGYTGIPLGYMLLSRSTTQPQLAVQYDGSYGASWKATFGTDLEVRLTGCTVIEYGNTADNVSMALSVSGADGYTSDFILGAYASFGYRTRWAFRRNSTAESGSNVGSDLEILAYNDTGDTIIFTPISIKRSTGMVNIQTGLRVGDTTAPTDNDIYATGDVAAAVNMWIGSVTSNVQQPIGLTIKVGSDATYKEVISLKASDVAHGMTSVTETDTFAYLEKLYDDAGGLDLLAAVDATGSNYHALSLRGIGYTETTAKSSSATATVVIQGMKTNSTTVQALAANGNVLCVKGLTNTHMLVDEDGEIHSRYQPTAGHITDFADEYDDIALLNGLRASLQSPKAQLDERFADFIEYAKPILESTGVVTYNDDGHHFIAHKRIQMLTIDAVRQFYDKQTQENTYLRSRISQLEKQVMLLSGGTQ